MKKGYSTIALFVLNATNGGGAEIAMMEVTRKLQDKGHSVAVCALNGEGHSGHDHTYVLERKWKAGFIETLKSYLQFRQVIHLLRPRIIIANCELPELFVAFATPRHSKIICVEHTSNPWADRKILGFLVRVILKLRNSYWVTVNSSEDAVWRGSSTPKYIPNPVSTRPDIDDINCLETETVFIGRLRAEKRPDWLIATAIQLDLKVDIFGDGNQKDSLEKRYSHLSSSVRFHGYVTNPWKLISKNSLVVVPSEYEGDGLVVVEAILRNYPILLADNSDLRRFGLPEKNYFQDEEELKLRLGVWKEAKENEFKIPRSIVKSLQKARDIEAIVEQWECLLSKL